MTAARGETLLKTSGLTKQFGGLVAVNDVDLEVKEGEILGVIGPNGAGKTTFFSLVGGFLKPTSGTVWFDGQDITGWHPHQICKAGLARTYQVAQPFPQLTIIENVMVGAYCHTDSNDEAREIAQEVVDFMGFTRQANNLAAGLSVPDRKKLEVAKAMATKPKMILLDEVMAGLRPNETQAQIEVIQKVADSGITLIVVEHVMKVIMSLSHRVVVLNQGAKIGDGEPRDIINMPCVIEAYLGGGAVEC